jgi:hypothetical protein
VARLTSNQVVVIHGSSGCGKSSFVRAGVLARLARECAREGLQWQTCSMRPGNSPLWNLSEAVARLPGIDGVPSTNQIRWVRQRLNLGRRAFARLARDLDLGPHRQICILLDQFEELFRFSDEIGLDEAELFADTICGLAANPPEGFHLLVTIRSDHLGDCSQFHGLADLINKHQYLLPRLDDEDMIRAIREPAALCKGEITLDLALRLLRDSDGEIDSLPLIQHSLMRMWQAVEGDGGPLVVGVDRYQGLREGLSRHADEILANVLSNNKPAADKETLSSAIELVFSALTAVDTNGRYIRRPQTFGQLLEITGLSAKALNAALRPFRDQAAGFVTPQGINFLNSEDIIDISHEALIRHWVKLAGSLSRPGWIQAEAAQGQTYRALLELIPGPLPLAAATRYVKWWQARPRTAAWGLRYGGRFEEIRHLLAKSELRHRMLLAGSIFGAVIVGAGSFYGYGVWQDAVTRDRVRNDVAFYARGLPVLVDDGPARALQGAVEGLKNPEFRLAPERLAYQALQTLHERFISQGPRFVVPQVGFSPASDLLVIGQAGTLKFMSLSTGEIAAGPTLADFDGRTTIKWLSDKAGEKILWAGVNKSTKKNSIVELKPCTKTRLSESLPICGAGDVGSTSNLLESNDVVRAISPDGRYALMVGGQQTRLLDLSTGKPVNENLPASINGAFNRDGTSVALVVDDGIAVFDLSHFRRANLPRTTGQSGEPGVSEKKPGWEMKGTGWRLIAFALGPRNTPAEGKLFTAANGVARLWDIRTGDQMELPPAASGTFKAVFSPNGDSVAATLDNGTVQVWRLSSDGAIPRSFKGHSGPVWSVSFSPDGRFIATGSNDGTARLWRLSPALGPQRTNSPELGRLRSKSENNRVVEDRGGILVVRGKDFSEPFVVLNRKPRKWQEYAFVPGGVAATDELGEGYFWTVFTKPAELAEFAQTQLPLCDGKPMTLALRDRAFFFGPTDSQIPPSPQAAPAVIEQGLICGYRPIASELLPSD